MYSLIVFCKEHSINKISVNWYNSIIQELESYSNKDKIETYRLKKGVERKKKLSLGGVISGYKNIINNHILNYEDIITNYLLEGLNSKELKVLKVAKEEVKETINKFNQKKYNDHKDLVRELNIVFDSYKLINDLSKNLNKSHLLDRNLKFNESILNQIYKNELNHDELIKINKLIVDFNKNKGKIKTITKETSLSNNSYIFTKAKKILLDKDIDNKNKQILLESFILNYEKEYTLNIIKDMDESLGNYKILTRIFKHSTPGFTSRVEAFINNNKKREFDLFYSQKDNINEYGNQVALALFLLIKPYQLISILFSKIMRIIGMSGGIKQTDFITNLVKEILITIQYNYKKEGNLNNLEPRERDVVINICSKLESITVESKFQLGLLLLEFIFSEFDYMFVKHIIKDYKENHIYLNVKPEYLAVLSGSIFNPMRLPMVTKPKEWEYTKVPSGVEIITTGGYLLDEFNELSSNNTIVRQNTFNKFDSHISVNQVDSVNFLNSRAFEINSDVLDILIRDWNNKEDSKIFKSINQLHPKTEDLDKLNLKEKIEVMSHNSKYWNYSNTLNIALLMKDQVIYFPTFLDFRGRVYPTPNYLSYQSGDLARGLLVFSIVNSEISSNPNYDAILKTILNDGELSYRSKTNLGNKLKNNIDYVKLYLANVFGKSKLSRKGKIKWFDSNIENMISTYENSFDSFVEKYVNLSKEPFQFISIFISYYRHKKSGVEIKTPILFDATCSGIQHLSALTKDAKIANLVNLVQNESPSDFYQYCIDKIKMVMKNLDDVELATKINQLDITRKWIKHSIMTVPYNVSSLGIADKLAEKFDKFYLTELEINKLNEGLMSLEEILKVKASEAKNIKIPKEKEINSTEDLEKNKENETKNLVKDKGTYIYIPQVEIYKGQGSLYLTSSELIQFANIVRTTVLNIIPPFIKLKKYFDDIINILDGLDLPFFWQTPAGMSVSMSGVEMISKRVKQNLMKKSKPISILIPTEQIDYKKIKLGLMPNFIHSLDASNIHLLTNNISKLKLDNINLYTIHDCFASDYNNIAIIELLVKHSFIELYFKKDYLEEIHNSFIKQIGGYTEIFKETNEKGKLIQYVLCSKTQVKKVKYIDKETKKISIKNKEVSNTSKLIIPELPSFEWEVDVDKLKNEILFNLYFIS